MEVNESQLDGAVSITMPERFDMQVHREFIDVQSNLRGRTSEVRVDLANTRYMDSSALGMLLMLREAVGGDAGRVTLANCGPEISKILEIANFESLFAIEH